MEPRKPRDERASFLPSNGEMAPNYDGLVEDLGKLFRYGFGRRNPLLRGPDTAQLKYLLMLSAVQAAAKALSPNVRSLQPEHLFQALKALVEGYIDGLTPPDEPEFSGDLTKLPEIDKPVFEAARKPAVLRVLCGLDPATEAKKIGPRRKHIYTDLELYPWMGESTLREKEREEFRPSLASWISTLDPDDAGQLVAERAAPRPKRHGSIAKRPTTKPAALLPPIHVPTERAFTLGALTGEAQKLVVSPSTSANSVESFERKVGEFLGTQPYLGRSLTPQAETLDKALGKLIQRAESPAQASLRLHQARLLNCLGRWQDALREIEKALELPEAPRGALLVEASKILLTLGEWGIRKQVVAEAMRSDVTNLDRAWMRQGDIWILDYQNRIPEAYREIAQLTKWQIENNVDPDIVRHRLARILIKRSRATESASLAERAGEHLAAIADKEDSGNPFPLVAAYGAKEVHDSENAHVYREGGLKALEAAGERVAIHLWRPRFEGTDDPYDGRECLEEGRAALVTHPYAKGVRDLSQTFGEFLLENGNGKRDNADAAAYLHLALVLGKRMGIPDSSSKCRSDFQRTAARLGMDIPKAQAYAESTLYESHPELAHFVTGWKFTLPEGSHPGDRTTPGP